MEVEHVSGADRVSERIEGLLLEDEARHNLALGILSTARAQPAVYPELYGWVVHDGGRVVGAALQTPPHNLVLVRPAMQGALDALAGAIGAGPPGLVGATPEVDAFADAWAERLGLEVTPVFEQRIYALRELVPPEPCPGTMRLATTADRALVLGWTGAFAGEALRGADDLGGERVARSVDARLAGANSGIALWEVEGRPVSLAGFGGPTPNGIRIGPVYTPLPHRRRGYGSAVTAAVSQMLLDRGHRFCFLYTDLANPTSNAIYQRIGYEPVCDSRELAFSPRTLDHARRGLPGG